MTRDPAPDPVGLGEQLRLFVTLARHFLDHAMLAATPRSDGPDTGFLYGFDREWCGVLAMNMLEAAEATASALAGLHFDVPRWGRDPRLKFLLPGISGFHAVFQRVMLRSANRRSAKRGHPDAEPPPETPRPDAVAFAEAGGLSLSFAEWVAMDRAITSLERAGDEGPSLGPIEMVAIVEGRGVMPYIDPDADAMRAGEDGRSIYIGDERHEVDEAEFAFVSEVLRAYPSGVTYREIQFRHDGLPENSSQLHRRLPGPIRDRIHSVKGYQYRPSSI